MSVGQRLFMVTAIAAALAGGADWIAPSKAETPKPVDLKIPHKFGEMVGLNVKFAQGEPQKDLPLLVELGVKWVRDGVNWRDVEPVAGKYSEFAPAFRERLKFYKEHDIGVCFTLMYENPKAYPDTPDDRANSINAAAYGRYAVEAAKLLKASGVRFVLELWNEPHNFTIKKKLGGEWNGKPPSPWVDHYVAMVSEAVKQVKAYDPQVKLLDDDDMWIIHYWFLEKGLPKDLDGIAFHPYAEKAIGPEMAAVGQDTSWTKPFRVVDADRSFASAVRRLREQALAKMGTTPALWATEWGWPVGGNAPYSLLTPDGKMIEDAVAAYIPRAYITAAASGVEVACWFSSYDSVDGPMGLRANGGRQRKAFGAMKTMTKMLGGCTLVRQCMGAGHPTSGVQGYVFRGADPKGYTYVFWDIDGESSIIFDHEGYSPVHMYDVQGKEIPIKMYKDRLRFDLSQSPAYFTHLPLNPGGIDPMPPAAPVKPVYLFP